MAHRKELAETTRSRFLSLSLSRLPSPSHRDAPRAGPPPTGRGTCPARTLWAWPRRSRPCPACETLCPPPTPAATWPRCRGTGRRASGGGGRRRAGGGRRRPAAAPGGPPWRRRRRGGRRGRRREACVCVESVCVCVSRGVSGDVVGAERGGGGFVLPSSLLFLPHLPPSTARRHAATATRPLSTLPARMAGRGGGRGRCIGGEKGRRRDRPRRGAGA